jgi:hypothetical protein
MGSEMVEREGQIFCPKLMVWRVKRMRERYKGRGVV